jgi:hypothetical protein
MDIGLLVAGQLWRLLRGTAYGIREGPRDARPTRPQSPYCNCGLMADIGSSEEAA